jgi:hypothetical protein
MPQGNSPKAPRKNFDPNIIILIFSFSLILIAFPLYLLLTGLLAVYVRRRREEE